MGWMILGWLVLTVLPVGLLTLWLVRRGYWVTIAIIAGLCLAVLVRTLPDVMVDPTSQNPTAAQGHAALNGLALLYGAAGPGLGLLVGGILGALRRRRSVSPPDDRG